MMALKALLKKSRLPGAGSFLVSGRLPGLFCALFLFSGVLSSACCILFFYVGNGPDFRFCLAGYSWLIFLGLLLFSTSLLGVVLIPALFVLLGAFFFAAAAAAWGGCGAEGLLLCLLENGLPMCFVLPCACVFGDRCFRLSRGLARSGSGPAFGSRFSVREPVCLLLCLVSDILYAACLLPALRSFII